MADPNLRDFYGRIYRIQKAHSRGGGFEAEGALGRSYFVAPPARSLAFGRLLRPLLYLAIVITLVKAFIFAQIGPATYASRVAALQKGDSIDRVGAFIMIVDPATAYLAGKIEGLRF